MPILSFKISSSINCFFSRLVIQDEKAVFKTKKGECHGNPIPMTHQSLLHLRITDITVTVHTTHHRQESHATDANVAGAAVRHCTPAQPSQPLQPLHLACSPHRFSTLMQPLINGFATQWIFSTLIPDTSRFTTLFVQIVRSKWLITIRSFVCRGMISSRSTSPSFLLPLKSCIFTPNNPRSVLSDKGNRLHSIQHDQGSH